MIFNDGILSSLWVNDEWNLHDNKIVNLLKNADSLSESLYFNTNNKNNEENLSSKDRDEVLSANNNENVKKNVLKRSAYTDQPLVSTFRQLPLNDPLLAQLPPQPIPVPVPYFIPSTMMHPVFHPPIPMPLSYNHAFPVNHPLPLPFNFFPIPAGIPILPAQTQIDLKI